MTGCSQSVSEEVGTVRLGSLAPSLTVRGKLTLEEMLQLPPRCYHPYPFLHQPPPRSLSLLTPTSEKSIIESHC